MGRSCAVSGFASTAGLLREPAPAAKEFARILAMATWSCSSETLTSS